MQSKTGNRSLDVTQLHTTHCMQFSVLLKLFLANYFFIKIKNVNATLDNFMDLFISRELLLWWLQIYNLFGKKCIFCKKYDIVCLINTESYRRLPWPASETATMTVEIHHSVVVDSLSLQVYSKLQCKCYHQHTFLCTEKMLICSARLNWYLKKLAVPYNSSNICSQRLLF